tara:strand:+ start:1793 stop:2467 length:675 start_codon:yes stop_codon:yes gene_type:complete
MAYQSKIIFPSNDAGQARTAQSSWSNARDGSTGTAIAYNSDTANIYSLLQTGRGGATYGVSRYYINFDLQSNLPYGSAVMSASLNLYYNTAAGAQRIVKHNDIGTLFSSGDFDACIYASGGTNSNEDMFSYSDSYTPSNTSAYTSIDLNETALTDIKNNAGTSGSSSGIFCVAAVQERDYTDSAPSDNADYSKVYQDYYTGTDRDPFVRIMYEKPQPIWFGTNF